MQLDGVRLEVDDRIATITLARPEKRNALSLEMLRTLIKALEAVPPKPGWLCSGPRDRPSPQVTILPRWSTAPTTTTSSSSPPAPA